MGEPEISHVQSGVLFRWTLIRASDLNMYITMDSPEYANMAHIMVSDSMSYQEKPVVSTILYSLKEADELIERIIQQWKGREMVAAPPIEEIGGREDSHGKAGLPPPGWREQRTD